MIEIFVVLLLILKGLGFISISWTTAIVISVAMILVEVRLYQNRKALINGLMSGAKVVDDKLEDIEFRLNSKQDRDDSSW